MAPTPRRTTRGTHSQPANRFAATSREPDPDGLQDGGTPTPQTQFIPDLSQSVISYNDSPDLGFKASLNPYRGCEHGCAYCYARPTHEYLGYSAGLDFETRILVKERAPELLRRELDSSRWQPQMLALSGVTDAYQPVERRLQLTRRCLEVLAECRNPVGIVTKNQLVTRDLDLLVELAKFQAISVSISITTLRPGLRAVLEPRTSPPSARLGTIKTLAEAGIPAGVLVAPVIPGLNDSEIPAIVDAAGRAGARFAGFQMLRLPLAVAPLFEEWLAAHLPDAKDKVFAQVRAMRGGKLNDARFGARMRGEGAVADQTRRLFEVCCRRSGVATEFPGLSIAAFRRPRGAQIELFG